MRQNTGEAFFHPVTHQLIEKGQFYAGAAHQEFEKAVEVVKETAEKIDETLEEIKEEVSEKAEDNAQKASGRTKKNDVVKDEESK